MANSSPLDHEQDLFNFIKDRINKSGGSIQLQHLAGHVLRVPHDKTIVISKNDIKNVILNHKEVFKLDKGVVTFHEGNIIVKTPKEIETNAKIPLIINEGKGVVIKVFPKYGFIYSKDPVKTNIYFTPDSLENKTFFSDSEIFPGAKVYFNAKKCMVNQDGKYRATKVWRQVNTENEVPIPNVTSNLRKKRETRLYDPINSEGNGKIKSIGPNYGLIYINNDHNDLVFFHKNKLQNYENIIDLSKILKQEDPVIYKAIRSTKTDSKARWEATKVWINMKKPVENNLSNRENQNYNDLLTNQKSNKHNKKIQKSKTQVNNDPKDKNETTREMHNISGKIYPKFESVIIKYGPDLNNLAQVDPSCQFYIYGVKVEDIKWEFADDDSIHFDAIRVNSEPPWNAILVWIGDRPNIVLPSDHSAFSDDEKSDIPDSDSCISEISESSFHSVGRKSLSFNTKNDPLLPFAKANCPSFGSSSNLTTTVFSETTNESYYSDAQENDSNFTTSEIQSYLNNKKILNWGDTPYPEEEFSSLDNLDNTQNYEREKSSSININNPIDTKDKYEDFINSEDDADISCLEDDIKSTPTIKDISTKSLHKNIGHYMHSQEEFHNTKEELYNSYEKISNQSDFKCSFKSDTDIKFNNLNKNVMNNIPQQDTQDNQNILIFSDIVGEVTKVDCKRATIYSPQINCSRSFSWNVFHYEGKPVEQNYEGLNEILKKGQTIKFLCYKVIDKEDNPHFYIPLAWIGNKPKDVVYLTIEKFIEDNKIEVKNASIERNQNFNQVMENEKLLHDLDSQNINKIETSIIDKPKIIVEDNQSSSIKKFTALTDKYKIAVQENQESSIKKFNTLTDIHKTCIQNNKGSPIKKFNSLRGKIIKLGARYVQIFNSSLKSPAIISVTDLYVNGLPIEEISEDILKVNDNIFFDCFEIIDDMGFTWEKVTLAWKDEKPKNIRQITPEEYIKKCNLKVTLDIEKQKNKLTFFSKEDDNYQNENNDVYNQNLDDKEKGMFLNNALSQTKIFSSNEHDKNSLQNHTSAPYSSNVLPINILSQKSNYKNKPKANKTRHPLSFEHQKIADDISIFLRDSLNAEKTIEDIASDLVRIYLSSTSEEELKKQLEKPNFLPSFLSKKFENDNLKDAAVQTTITGDIISKTIFPL